jgi:glycosyltransferase involved in cell wall biosynthesis
MPKYRVLVVLPTDNIGGAERVAFNLVTMLSNEYSVSVDVYFLSRGDNGHWVELQDTPNINLVYCNARRESLGLVSFLQYLLKNRKKAYDLCYSTHLHVNALISVIRKLNLIVCYKHCARESTVIFDRFSGLKLTLFRFLYWCYFDVDLVICQTSYMKKRFQEEVGTYSRHNIKVIKNPVNIDYIDDKIKFGNEVCPNLKFGVKNIIFVGRLIDIKNLPLLLTSLHKLKQSYTQFHLSVLGDGNAREECERITLELGLENNVTFYGNVANPFKYMEYADLGIVSSKKEGFPNVIIEMMASGTKNIITTPCAGDLELLPDVSVLENHSADTLYQEIKGKMMSHSDFSKQYREYAESISIQNYWSSLQSEIYSND